MALVFTRDRGWRYEVAPSFAWPEAQEQLLVDDEDARLVWEDERTRRHLQVVLAAVSALPMPPVSLCRPGPGPGPCQRRHVHGGRRPGS